MKNLNSSVRYKYYFFSEGEDISQYDTAEKRKQYGWGAEHCDTKAELIDYLKEQSYRADFQILPIQIVEVTPDGREKLVKAGFCKPEFFDELEEQFYNETQIDFTKMAEEIKKDISISQTLEKRLKRVIVMGYPVEVENFNKELSSLTGRTIDDYIADCQIKDEEQEEDFEK